MKIRKFLAHLWSNNIYISTSSVRCVVKQTHVILQCILFHTYLIYNILSYNLHIMLILLQVTNN
jgi:hypothetical protein